MNVKLHSNLLSLFTICSLFALSHALNINLSSLWNLIGWNGEEEEDHMSSRDKLVFPRRDLIQEFGGQDNYNRVIQHALGMKQENGQCNDEEIKCETYGVDVSFPMHYVPNQDSQGTMANSNDNEVEGDEMSTMNELQSKEYQRYINGCNEFYSSLKIKTTTPDSSMTLPCNQAEQDRFDMNLNQPPIMQNYTMLGFHKTKVPKQIFQQISHFWKQHQLKQKQEAWGKNQNGVVIADTHVNHWKSPTYMVHIDNPYFEGGGMDLKNSIWNVARLKLEDWINNGASVPGDGNNDEGENNVDGNDGEKWTLNPTSLYGIRVYKSDSILAPHVDRLPLVTSAIINVDQDVDEDWPLEVIGHDGVAYNITMEPGDMLLYESHSVIHGRPYPLKGRFYANIFVHFEPQGHCVRHGDRMDGKKVDIEDAKALYERAQKMLMDQIKDVDNSDYSYELPLINALRERYDFEFDSEKGVVTEVPKVENEEESDERRRQSTPYFIERNSEEEERWNQEVMYEADPEELQIETIDIHKIASSGKVADLAYAFQLSPLSILKRDENGWQPLHEAVRSGHLNVIKFIVEKGSSINSRTGKDGNGGSVLWWALHFHDKQHPIVVYLKEKHARNIAPGGKEIEYDEELVLDIDKLEGYGKMRIDD